MDTRVDEDAIRKLGKEIAKGIKTEADLGDFSKLLKKIVVETALDAELTDHLGYDKHNPDGNGSGNSRNVSLQQSKPSAKNRYTPTQPISLI